MTNQLPFLHQNLLIASKKPHKSLSSCCRSLLVQINVLKHLDANLHKCKPLTQILNSHGTLVRLSLRFPSSFKCALLPNFNKIVELELLILIVYQLKDTFSIIQHELERSGQYVSEQYTIVFPFG
jgi:hypothetical protein